MTTIQTCQPDVAARERLAGVLAGIGAELVRWNVPGLSIAVVHGGDVAYAGGAGRGRVDDPAPVTGRTLFHHGSCCKAYTSLLACLLADEGLLDLDEPVRVWVPELRLPDEDREAQITTRDLLSHRSGISRHDLTWILNPSWDRAELVRRLEHLPLAAGLRERMEYSNLGYTLAGLVVERVTGSSWDEQLRERVLTPLGMARTTTSVDRMRADADAATPHLLRDGAAVPTADRHLVGAAPAGALMTSAEDVARWLLLQLGAGDAVSAAAVTATHQVAVGLPADLKPFAHLELEGYGLGWLAARFRGLPMLWHSGGVDGFATQTFLLPEQRVGVVVSANLHSSLLPLAAGLQLVDALADTADEQPWYDVLHPMVEAAAAGAAPPSPTTVAPARSVSELAGTYTDPGYGDLVLRSDGVRLLARLGESDLTARHVDGDTWELRYDVLDAPYAVTFEPGPDGAIAAAIAPLDPTSVPTRFVRRAASWNGPANRRRGGS